MHCANCKEKWPISFPQQNRLWKPVQDIRGALEDLGVPVNYAHTTLDVLDALVGCCDKPDIIWEEKLNEH